MCMIDDCDERSTVLGESHPVARKKHKCGECRRVIEPGERYLAESLLFEGEVSTHKTCAHCEVARDWLARECGGWIYSGVAEDIREHVTSGYYGMAVARMAVGMSWKWRGKNGELFPVPSLPKTTHEEGART
jgi:hypothetical protein